MEFVAKHDTTDSRAFTAGIVPFQATWRLPPQFSDFKQVRRLSMTGCAVHWSMFR